MICLHEGILCSDENGQTIFASAQINLRNATFAKDKQTKKHIYYLITFITSSKTENAKLCCLEIQKWVR